MLSKDKLFHSCMEKPFKKQNVFISTRGIIIIHLFAFFFNINDKKIYNIIIIWRGSLKKTARLWERSLTFSNIFKSVRLTIANKRVKPLNSQDLISNSPYCLPNDSHYVSLENLVSDQSSHINCMADSKENYS